MLSNVYWKEIMTFNYLPPSFSWFTQFSNSFKHLSNVMYQIHFHAHYNMLIVVILFVRILDYHTTKHQHIISFMNIFYLKLRQITALFLNSSSWTIPKLEWKLKKWENRSKYDETKYTWIAIIIFFFCRKIYIIF